MVLKKHTICFLILILVLTCLFTYPLIFKMNSAIPGFENTNEPQASLWYYWWQKYAWHNKLDSLGACPILASPFGVDFKKGANFYPVWLLMTKWLSIASNPFFTYNLQVFLSFILSGLFMYLLVLYLTKDKLSALLAGVVYTFLPYHFARIWQHLGLSQIQWMPLFILSMFKLKEKLDIKAIIFCSAAFLLVATFDYYYAYFMAVGALCFIVYLTLFELKKNKKFPLRTISSLALALFLAVLVLSPILFSIVNKMLSPSTTEELMSLGYSRPFRDLFTQSAKPLSYLLPATTHPIFGKFTEQFIGSPLYGISYTEHALFLGWIPLIFAFVAFKRRRGNFAIGFFVFLAIIAWLFSQPPYFTFPNFKIYMPSFFMYKILPMFRAYCRFGVVLMLAVSVLAGFGLKFLLERFKSEKVKIVATSLICGLVLFEFLNFPPVKIVNLMNYPKVYDWLKEQKGDFVIAEYPLDTESPNEYYKFCQTIHQKRMINGSNPGTHANKVANSIWKLSEPKNVEALSWMEVKYVLVHLDIYEKSNDIETLDEVKKLRTRRIKNLRFIKSFDSVDVYEITAEPKKPNIRKRKRQRTFN